MNHTNRSIAGREGKALAEKIMSALAGRVGMTIGGERVQWNSLKSKSRLHVGDTSIPVGELPAHLTQHERDNLEHLPFWNGNNSYEISKTCLVIISAAISRFIGVDAGSDVPVDVQKQRLWQCFCGDCAKKRADDIS